jgi:hypothetical protein
MDLFTVSRPADPAVTALRACVALLPERDQSFARSLLDAAARRRRRKYGLTTRLKRAYNMHIKTAQWWAA